ncbi:hypothetical protein P170DRAFT_360773 [Aspergillus steynii IBT 23096]|uniref:Rhodopsin domain-containing protein n=1 Tax=Aspergillus steynii IBT 23096 TaxID=1392250 RepID=A0A2I2G6C5_9EURO|nr:uncharacterized protein P170DRAFT_360773 [Aspergillus steynii IBT 23096]PLB48435.1 hypothetical protein P170DRAFT_360773 [Aspergillus steynii IBT 23096]
MNIYSAILARTEDDTELASENHLGHIMGIQTALTVAAVVVVCLRLYVRMRLVRSHGSDDWTMSLAAVSCHGLGRHIQFIDQTDRIKMTQAAFWQVIICSAAGIAFLKISIALNLLRFSPTRWYTGCLWAGIGLVSTYSFMGAMTFFLHCKPMQAHWDTRIKDAQCYSVHLFVTFALVNTSFNIFTDILFATLPIPVIWNLQMKRRVRMYLIGVLSLGYIAVGLGIVKTVYQLAYGKSIDTFFNDSIIFWALAQFNTGIIAACVPSLKPLVSRVLKLSEYTNSRSRSHVLYGSSAVGRHTTTRSRNSRRMWSMHRGDQYALEELQSNDTSAPRQSDEVRFNGKNKTISSGNLNGKEGRGAVMKTVEDHGAGVDGEEGMEAEQSPKGGILKTTQLIISSRVVD